MVPVRLQMEPKGLQPGSHRVDFHVAASDDTSVAAHEKSIFFSR
jgi:hypothetical protein